MRLGATSHARAHGISVEEVHQRVVVHAPGADALSCWLEGGCESKAPRIEEQRALRAAGAPNWPAYAKGGCQWGWCAQVDGDELAELGCRRLVGAGRESAHKAAANRAHLRPGREAGVGDEAKARQGDGREQSQLGIELGDLVLLELAAEGALQPGRLVTVLAVGVAETASCVGGGERERSVGRGTTELSLQHQPVRTEGVCHV